MHAFLTDVATVPFLRQAFLAGLLVSVVAGVIGSIVTARRISYIAAAIAHCTLGGMGAARYLQVERGWESATPFLGALAAALLAAFVIGVVTLYWREREDTVLSAVWAVGMAVGLLLIFKTRSYNEDLMSYLFGDILMVGPGDLAWIAGLDVVVLLFVALLYRQLLAVSFDEEFAGLRGMPVGPFYLLLLGLTAVTVVLMVWVVGIVMVIALLTLPAAAAGVLTRTLWQMMLLGTVFAAFCTAGGQVLAYGPGLPPGATIILCAAALYLLVLAGRGLVRRLR